MLTNKNWKGFSELMHELMDMYSEDTTFKVADSIDTDQDYLKVKQFLQTRPTEQAMLDYLSLMD